MSSEGAQIVKADAKSAIRVEALSKRYRIGVRRQGQYRTLREALADASGRTLRRLRRAGRGGPAENQADEVFWALKDISFDVRKGEVVGIIGSNGAGKSTLLKVLSRIVEPTAGRAEVRGRVGSLLEVGTGFHPELTGRENVFLNGAILGMTRVEIARKFDAIVAFAELSKFIDTPVKRYSSGMYVRLAFAVAAHLEPEILIVDEVLAVGDAAFQEKCMGTMRQTASSGRTILFVSHNMASIQQLCTRAVLLKEGRVAADGTPRAVVGDYLANLHATRDGSITDWRDRESNGQARIVRLEAADADGNRAGSVPVGGSVRFTITADFREPIFDPGFGVVVHTIAGEPLLDLRSSHAGLRLGRVSGRVVIDATVPVVGLYPGEYLLSPWISDASCNEILDWAKQCVTLHVHPSPGPHGDLRLDERYGKYWVQSNWSAAGRDADLCEPALATSSLVPAKAAFGDKPID
jgi:lipopolysaccharide transport system ATP-binding protein